MKKIIISIIFIAILSAGIVACGTNSKPNNESVTQNENSVKIESSTACLSKIWELIPEADKFPALGGDIDNSVDGKPGAYKNADGIIRTLLIPKDQVSNTDDIASIIHAMNTNTFTGVVAHVTTETKSFIDSLKENINQAQWMCGAPEKLIIAEIADGYVCYAYGESTVMVSFSGKLKEAFPSANIMYEEDIKIEF